MSEPQISVLIVAFNSISFIEECILALQRTVRKTSYEILLIDNGKDGTQQLVSSHFPDVRIFPSQGNIGFAAANNELARHARADKLLLLNPDMVVCDDAVDALYDGSLRHPEAVAWGGLTLGPDGKPDAGNRVAIPEFAELLSFAMGRSLAGRADRESLSRESPARVLMGGFVLICGRTWRAFSGLDERFFLYCEEVDFFVRLEDAGHECWRIPAARAKHFIAHGNNLSGPRLLFRAAGTVEFIEKHWPAGLQAFGIFLLWLGAFNRFIGGILLGNFSDRAKKIGSAYRAMAVQPTHFIYGYDRDNGLATRLGIVDWLERQDRENS